VEGLLEDLAVGSDLRLWDVLDLLNLIDGFYIHAFQLDRVVGVGLATDGPGEESSLTSCSIEG
jgi:hypothetical protein